MKFNQIKYSRGQQMVFVVLACFIVGCFVVDWLWEKNVVERGDDFVPDSTLIVEIERFEKGLDSIEMGKKRKFEQPDVRIIKGLRQERFRFDPNEIDSAEILRLGFQPFMAHNWLQYKRHGGKIYSVEKLRKIYGIDTLLVDSLKDYITFASVKVAAKRDSIVYTQKVFFEFELNSADTALLRKLPGIGKGRAAMIVARRMELGGFYTAEQLREIENIPDSIIDNIIPYISVEVDSIRKIDLNKTGMKRWKEHPYIGYYRARDIYNLKWDKRHKGKIRNIEELRELENFTEEDFERVKWYIKID